MLFSETPLLLQQRQHLEELHLVDLVEDGLDDAPVEARLVTATEQLGVFFNLAHFFLLKFFIQEILMCSIVWSQVYCIQLCSGRAKFLSNCLLEW
jgi:hypothetical protein